MSVDVVSGRSPVPMGAICPQGKYVNIYDDGGEYPGAGLLEFNDEGKIRALVSRAGAPSAP